jgi:hypothetical protein
LSFTEDIAYPHDDWQPELSPDEEVGSVTEERLDDGRVDRVKERTGCELSSFVSYCLNTDDA